MVMEVMKSANLILRFLLELGVVAGLGYWGFGSGTSVMLKVALGVGVPVVAVVVWGMFGAPRSTMALHGSMHLLLEVLLFGSAAVALWASGRPSLAVAFGVTVAINRVLMSVWGQ